MGQRLPETGVKAKALAWVIRVLPKKGPLRALAFRIPTPEVEKLFMKSLNSTVVNFRVSMARAERGRYELPNQNFDASLSLTAGIYKGADLAYGKLLDRHAAGEFAAMRPELRRVILNYYPNFNATGDGK